MTGIVGTIYVLVARLATSVTTAYNLVADAFAHPIVENEVFTNKPGFKV